MERSIQNYRQISCGCCTGREAVIEADWGKYTVRTDQCVCWNHRDTPRGVPPTKCSVHTPRSFDFPAR